MTTSITRPWRGLRTPQQKLEAALLAAFRNMAPGERFKLVRFARLRRSGRRTQTGQLLERKHD